MYLLNERIDPTVKELEEEFKMLVRDISIDVHRAYLSKHKEEHEAKLGKKTEIAQEKPLEESLCASISSKVSPNSSCARSMCSWHTLSPFCFIVTSEAIEEADGRKPELKPAKVMEAGTAFELRALRHAHRVEEIGKVLALDNDKVFVEACKRNRQFNGYVACSKVEAYLADARVFKLTHPKEFEVLAFIF